MPKLGICKFCNQKKELINAHIIPKCFYQMKTWGNMARIRPETQQIDRNQQNGLKEYLLCAKCDNNLGKLDEHAHRVLFNIIPKHEFKVMNSEVKRLFLPATEYDYDKLRRFFISLVWRVSICESEQPFPLDKYKEIALKILKNEIPDDEDLFLPLIYRKSTNIPVDYITGFFSDNFLGQRNCRFRFPNYEVVIIINTNNSNDSNLMGLLKQMFTRDEIDIHEISSKSFLDNILISEMVKIQKANKQTLIFIFNSAIVRHTYFSLVHPNSNS